MVMPHSALQAGQYREWRTGDWKAQNGPLSVDFGFKTAWDLEKLKPNTFFPMAASVTFAKRTGVDGKATPLAGHVEQWVGATGTNNVRRVESSITDTSAIGESPYAARSRQGATIVPRCLFFVDETESTVLVRTGGIITVNPRRGSQDKAPWKTLDLTDITDQTIETKHVYDIHLGETIVPYATLDPLKAVLPVRRTDDEIPADPNGIGGIKIAGLERRMRRRWQTVSELWERNKAHANKLSLLERFDYHRELSSQLEWQQDPGDRLVRVVYTRSGTPTAALLPIDEILVDTTAYWVTCKNVEEANYLLAVINSQALYEEAQEFMSKGQFGARDLHKHLWKLPIPEFDEGEPAHVAISDAGRVAAEGAAERLSQLRGERDRLTVTVARREIRKWLAGSEQGRAVEALVGELLSE